MAFWRLYYHLAWATKGRLPLITEDIERRLHRQIISKSKSLGCYVHGIGGMPDHIHVVVSIPPTLAVAKYISQTKGGSSHFINHNLDDYRKRFAWQDGYGAFSLGGRQLADAVGYVSRQKAHHADGTTNDLLETFVEQEPAPDADP